MKITHHIVHIEKLSEDFTGYRILQISDLHIGRRSPERKIFDIISKIQADIAIFTGDIVHKPKYTERAKRFLEDFTSSITFPDGVIGILGNHEKKISASQLNISSIRWLMNSAITITRKSSAINLVGLDQRYYSMTDIISALSEIDNSVPTIIAAHFPSTAMLVNHIPSLVIAGHTHAGQIKIPGFPFMTNDDISWRNGYGLSRIGETQLVVSSGVGYSGPISLRLFAPSELTIIELRTKKQ